MESSCPCYDRVEKLIRFFLEALRQVEKLTDEATSEDLSFRTVAMGATHFQNAVFSSANEHDIPLFIDTAAGYTSS